MKWTIEEMRRWGLICEDVNCTANHPDLSVLVDADDPGFEELPHYAVPPE